MLVTGFFWTSLSVEVIGSCVSTVEFEGAMMVLMAFVVKD
jgi:hypothetical protein